METSPLLEIKEKSNTGTSPVRTSFKIYKRRWYILFLFSLFSGIQNWLWNTWAPITKSAKTVFNWTDEDIALLTNWGNVIFIIFLVPVTWIIYHKGLRPTCILTIGLMVVGSGLKCIPVPELNTWIIHAGQILISVAETATMCGQAMLSVLWFPPEQRTTATAFISSSTSLGLIGSFLVGPILMPDPTNLSWAMNMSLSINWTEIYVGYEYDLAGQRSGIYNYMYLELGVIFALFLAVLIYFPNKPPLSPSNSASLERMYFLQGWFLIFRKKSFWIISISFSVFTGVFSSFIYVLYIILQPLDVSQSSAGWLGFYSVLATWLGSIIWSRITDYFQGYMKAILILLHIAAIISNIWFLLLFNKIIPYSEGALFTSIILQSVFTIGATPIFIEMAVEDLHPIAESVITGLMVLIFSMVSFCIVFLVGILEDTLWFPWCLLCSLIVSCVLLSAFQVTYNRLRFDQNP